MNLIEMNAKLAKHNLVLHPTKGFRRLSSAAPRMTREMMALRESLLPKAPAGKDVGEYVIHLRPETSRHRARTWRTPLLSAPFEARGKSYAGAAGVQEASRRYRRMQVPA